MKIIGIEDQEEKEKRLNKKKIIITSIVTVLVILIITIICLYMGNKQVRDFMDKYIFMKNVTENNVTSISIEENQTNNIFSYDKYISVFSKNILTGYNSSGKQEYTLTIEISNPIVDTNNRFLLMGEKDQKKIYLISGNSVLWEKELEGNISRVSVNKNGYVSVILSGTTYKSVIQTFDSTGKELFKTYLSNTIAMDSDISFDNRYLSFAEVSTNGTTVQSTIKTISIQKASENPSESIVNTITGPSGSLISNIKYQENNRLVCMYDDTIHIIENGKDEELIKLIEENKKINYSDIELTNYSFRVIEKSILLSTQSTIEIVNVGSKKTVVYTIEGAARNIYCYDNAIAINLGSEVHFIGTNGWLIKKYTSSQEIRKIIMNSNFAGIVYRDKIEIINL